ncbi:polysaccharide biosynthesis tyrosine autokinase [Halovulum sp. GXIMD14793]
MDHVSGPPDLTAPAAAPLDRDAPEISLRMVWRGRWWILLGALAGALLGGAYAYRVAVPVYRTHAVVMFDPQEQTVVEMRAILPALGRGETMVTTQVEVLRSRRLLEKLVGDLNLTTDPEFNAYRRSQDGFSLRKYIKDHLLDWQLIREVPAPPVTQQTELDATVKGVLRSLTISNLPNSFVFSIAAETRSADKSSLIANRLAEIYIEDQLAAKMEATEQASAWLSGRVVELQADFEAAEHRANALRARIEPDTSDALNDIERRLAALRQRKLSATGDARVALTAQEALLQADFDAASADLVQLQQLDRQAEASRLIYEYFLGRLKESTVQAGVLQPDARLISRAIVPLYPAAPQKPLILALAAILGAGLGTAWVLARAQWVASFRRIEDLEEATGRPVLGQIPQLAERNRNVVDFVLRKPSSQLAEAVRDLRTSVLLSSRKAQPQVIAVTSSVPHEGKSMTSIMLAQNMAGWGKKVLLIEADIRRQTFQRYLGADPQRGILSVLAGICEVDEAIFRPDGMSIDVLFGESSSTNAADIFATERFEQFLAKMRDRYDYIILDTPPVLVVTDARVIAPTTDAVIYAVRWNATRRAQVRRGLQMLQSINGPVTGLVLTRVDQRRMEKLGYGRRYGSYARKSQYYVE